jgi:hypothetical protein
LVLRVIVIIIVTGVIVAVSIIPTAITTTVTSAGIMALAGLLATVATAVTPIRAGGNTQDLARIDIIRVIQTIDLSNMIGIYPITPADAK